MHEHTLFEVLEERILLSGSLNVVGAAFFDLGDDAETLTANALVNVGNSRPEIGPILGGVDLLDLTAAGF
ncbi:MAG: LEPR-XLL domain-containing protein [Phycisphaerae bacterium]|jgi:hypothetical protein|nr:LEPR-XLL domain-containing protein [Phycisphaerae bacterium]